MKILISFYSRTGTTRKAAEDIEDALIVQDVKVKTEEVIDKKDRDGKTGYVIAGKDAMMKKETEIEEVSYDPENFDMLIVGTPVWAGKMTPAIRTYMEKYKDEIDHAAFFCTHGGGGESKTFDDMKEIVGEPREVLSLRDKEVKEREHLDDISNFSERIL
ncbi:MAG: flavodoxin family protein [Thermoplasmatota archaeon]